MVNQAIPERRQDLKGKRVLVTGHTGFKGSWLCEWLLSLGARVYGIGLPPERKPNLFDTLNLAHRIEQHEICDIRDGQILAETIDSIAPELVFHLAAQALVRRSYRMPLLTWETNVQGTLNVLEALHSLNKPVKVVVITTDKVYRNREWEFSYREDDELGGHDPYSASKAACELAISSWHASFAHPDRVCVATARAGNVIGLGDNSEDRLIPDCFRAWNIGETVKLRNPHAIRPWQHVLEPLSGYLALAAELASSVQSNIRTCNFGPSIDGSQSVLSLVSALANGDSGRPWTIADNEVHLHETSALTLNTERARLLLNWSPRLTFSEAVAWTSEGYSLKYGDIGNLVRRQIDAYEKIGQKSKLWTNPGDQSREMFVR